MSSFVLFCLLVGITVSVPHRSGGIKCNVGDADDFDVSVGFAACEAVYDFGDNTVALNGRHKAKHQASQKGVNLELVFSRTQECTFKNYPGGFEATCVCFEDLCNAPVTPTELIEEKFKAL